MKNSPRRTRKKLTRTGRPGLTLGLTAFEKISAVEGVRLTPEMKSDLQSLDSQGMTAEERTRFIAGKYGRRSA